MGCRYENNSSICVLEESIHVPECYSFSLMELEKMSIGNTLVQGSPNFFTPQASWGRRGHLPCSCACANERACAHVQMVARHLCRCARAHAKTAAQRSHG